MNARLERDDMRAHILNSVGVARMSLGDLAGLADVEASRELARGVSRPEYLRACGNLASVLVVQGQLKRASELHREALHVAREIGYEEPTRWLSTEVATDLVLAGDWAEARRIVDELMPGYERSPYWIEPQTRICRARMLLAEGAVVDAERATELSRVGDSLQNVSAPLAFRARLHAELGEPEEAMKVADELMRIWTETRSGNVEAWVLDLWFAVWRTGKEDQLQGRIDALHSVPWLEVAAALIRRDFDAAAAQLDDMGAASPAALARLWGADWFVEQGRQKEANVLLEPSLAFWHSVGARSYVARSEVLLAAAS
jgi:hypothetical protein